MSRSYKKFPKLIQEKEDYRYLNRRLRHYKLEKIPKGSSYKKFTIKGHDWTYRWSKTQAIQDWNKNSRLKEDYPTEKEFLNYWKRCVIRK